MYCQIGRQNVIFINDGQVARDLLDKRFDEEALDAIAETYACK